MRILLILSTWLLLLLSGCEFWNLSDKHSPFDGDEDQDITDIDQTADEDTVSETDDLADGDEEDSVDENDSSDNDAIPPGFTLRGGTFAPGSVTYSNSTSWGVYGGIVSTPRATDSKSTSFTVTGKTVWNAPEE